VAEAALEIPARKQVARQYPAGAVAVRAGLNKPLRLISQGKSVGRTEPPFLTPQRVAQTPASSTATRAQTAFLASLVLAAAAGVRTPLPLAMEPQAASPVVAAAGVVRLSTQA